jgi:hypothetical protein
MGCSERKKLGEKKIERNSYANKEKVNVIPTGAAFIMLTGALF